MNPLAAIKYAAVRTKVSDYFALEKVDRSL